VQGARFRAPQPGAGYDQGVDHPADQLDDGPILAVLDELRLSYESVTRRFEPTLRSSWQRG